jgi:hypothetical protein
MAADAAWEALGHPPPVALASTRAELHWAAQVLAAAAAALIAPAPDDSHTSLEWVAARAWLAGVRTPAGLRAALRPADLTLLALGEDDAPVAELPLAGRTLAEALDWMNGALRAQAGVQLRLPSYEMPAHPVQQGARFFDDGASAAARAELTRWYAAADHALRTLARAAPGASAVRCWPHHFDIATLLPGSSAAGSTVGIGLSPGDASYAEPYFYVTPWPYPRDPVPPPLPAGARWHREGWFGAVLTGTVVVDAAPSARGAAVASFMEAAVAACRSLLT